MFIASESHRRTQTKRRLLVSADSQAIAAAFAQLIPNVFLAETLKSRTERLSRLHRVIVVPFGFPSDLGAISKMQEEAVAEAVKEEQKEDGRGKEEETSRRALEASQFFSGIY